MLDIRIISAIPLGKTTLADLPWLQRVLYLMQTENCLPSFRVYDNDRDTNPRDIRVYEDHL